MFVKPSQLPEHYSDKITLLHAVDRPLVNLTVGQICENAGITRKKFYKLFSSKDEIIHWYLDFCFGLSLYEIGRTLTWHEGIVACLELTNDERDFFMLDYSNRSSRLASWYWPLNVARRNVMAETLREWRHVSVTPELEVEMHAYSASVPDLIRRYIEGKFSLGLDEYADVWEDCVPRRLHDALTI